MNHNEQERWYAVNLLYETFYKGESTRVKVYEEVHILVRSISEEQACQIGEQIGKEREQLYENMYGGQVYCALVKTIDCSEISDDELTTGAELYFRPIIVSKEESTEEVMGRFFPRVD